MIKLKKRQFDINTDFDIFINELNREEWFIKINDKNYKYIGDNNYDDPEFWMSQFEPLSKYEIMENIINNSQDWIEVVFEFIL